MNIKATFSKEDYGGFPAKFGSVEYGLAATIAVGQVVSGDTASVINVGTAQNALFNFVLPRGAQGPQGEKGDTGDTGPRGPKVKRATPATPGPRGRRAKKEIPGASAPRGPKGKRATPAIPAPRDRRGKRENGVTTGHRFGFSVCIPRWKSWKRRTRSEPSERLTRSAVNRIT